MELEKGKYLFVTSLDKFEALKKAYCCIIYGPGCNVPLEVTELSYVLKSSEIGEDYVLGDFTLTNYVVEDLLKDGSELLYCPKFLSFFRSIKPL